PVLRARGDDEVLVTALLRVPLAVCATADQARLTLPRQERGKLELVEVDGPNIGMAELDQAGVEVVGDEQPGIAVAIRRIDAGARLWHGPGIGLRPAGEPRRRRLRRLIGAEDDRSEPLVADRFVEVGLPGGELPADLGAKILRRRRALVLHALQQRRGKARRHEEADELAAE